jgi:hypothetical protein
VAAPAFVAAGAPVYGSSSAWPSSLTIGTADVPSGVIAGDRLILFVQVQYGQRTFPTVDDTLGSFGGVSTWTAIGTASFSAGGGSATQYWQLWAYTIRYDATLFPLTLTPQGTTSGTAYTPISGAPVYRAQLCAWRPSAAYGSRATGTAFNNATLIPNGSYSSNLSLTNTDGLLVAAATLPGTVGTTGPDATIGTLSSANGFTERFHQTPITNRGGSLKIADQTPGATGSYGGPLWTKPGAFPTNPSGAAMLIAFNDPDPSMNEWGVDQVRW